MDDLTASDLFSPSKARQQRAQAQDWAHIDSWLSNKYNGRTVPSFERNDDTLKILRDLYMANERADEERAVIERMEREALKELDEEAEKHIQDKQVLQTIAASLTPHGEQALRALATTAVVLNTPSAAPETIAHAIIQRTITSQNLTNQLAHIQTLQAYLDRQQALLRAQLDDLGTNPAFKVTPSLSRLTTERTRQIKHLRAKVREHEDKLSLLQASQTRNTTPAAKNIGSNEAITDMLEQQTNLDVMTQKVEALERQVQEFAGLPADREMARKEVGKLEMRLDEQKKKRDGLFGDLVEKK